MRRILASAAAAVALALCGSGVAGAATGWTVQPVPQPADGVLTSVSCLAADDCVAVGAKLATEFWDGTSWAVSQAAVPAGSINSELTGVSCLSADDCTAVGDYFPTKTTERTLAEHWDGSTWTIETTPNPKASFESSLAAVSCASADRCMAVGTSSDNGALAEQWNGTKWAIKVAPNPGQEDELSSVSCVWAADCTAVGSTYSGTLAEHWNGSAWTVQATPTLTGYNALSGVSCLAADLCTAVGVQQDSSGTPVTLAEGWDGTEWSVEMTPAPASGVYDADLNAVSCVSADRCTAVGLAMKDGSDAVFALAEVWNGSAWTTQETAQPGKHKDLEGISCMAARICTAVGAIIARDGSSHGAHPLAENE